MSTWDPPTPPQPSCPRARRHRQSPHDSAPVAAHTARGLNRRLWKLPLWGWLAGIIGLFVVAGVFAPDETEHDDGQRVAATVSDSTTAPSIAPIVPQPELAPSTATSTQPPPTSVPPGSVLRSTCSTSSPSRTSTSTTTTATYSATQAISTVTAATHAAKS